MPRGVRCAKSPARCWPLPTKRAFSRRAGIPECSRRLYRHLPEVAAVLAARVGVVDAGPARRKADSRRARRRKRKAVLVQLARLRISRVRSAPVAAAGAAAVV